MAVLEVLEASAEMPVEVRAAREVYLRLHSIHKMEPTEVTEEAASPMVAWAVTEVREAMAQPSLKPLESHSQILQY